MFFATKLLNGLTLDFLGPRIELPALPPIPLAAVVAEVLVLVTVPKTSLLRPLERAVEFFSVFCLCAAVVCLFESKVEEFSSTPAFRLSRRVCTDVLVEGNDDDWWFGTCLLLNF